MNWAADRLGLTRTRAIHGRAEAFGVDPAYRERYDWVSARGVAALQTLAEWTMPFARLGGRVFAIKGEEIEAELKAARRAFRVLGATEPPRVVAYARADGGRCCVLEFIKREWTPSPYPRRADVAARIPL
jgi:16S rRNA (guanine527-N7)-methyltransferase